MDILNSLGLLCISILAIWKVWEIFFGSRANKDDRRAEVQRNLNKLLVEFFAEYANKLKYGEDAKVSISAQQELLHDFTIWLEEREKKNIM